jgi:methylated-DNA-protein-cysteine methyltransferase-like protein
LWKSGEGLDGLLSFFSMKSPLPPQSLRRKILKDSFRPNQSRELAFLRIIRSVPKGRVSTYGKVAAAAGYPLYARAVATFLRKTPHHALPWQRIVGANGEIKLKGDASREQRLRLTMEGVKFRGKRVQMEYYEHPIRSWEESDEPNWSR